MFQSLSSGLNKVVKNLSGRGRLTESNISDTMREVRIALLEADVALPIVKDFITEVKAQALGQKVIDNINPGQALVKIVNDALVKLMGEKNDELNLKAQPPAVILMAGLQGSGKTTTVAKLANLLKEKHNKKVMVCSADVYRPAAIHQLETLAKQIDVAFFPSNETQKPLTIVTDAIKAAKKEQIDVLLLDTAGRLHVDNHMMDEIKALHQASDPVETLFVVDSMTGQDAAKTAKAFNDALPLTGVILTKIDGDARGGAALSIRQITGKPIKFLGVGEKIHALEAFHPERIASRILGMGDVVSLVEEAEQKLDKKKAEKMVKKLKKGGFDLEDFLEQLQQMKKMGGIAGIMSKIPGASNLPAAAKEQASDGALKQTEAIIYSMTAKERRFPAIIKGSRKRRIAKGSGTEVQDVNRLLKQFMQMQKMMKKFKKGGMTKMMRQMKGMMPPGGPGGGFPPLG